jgi:hypothetical protein
VRQLRLPGRRRVRPEIAGDLIPGGLGSDPISFVIALPALVVLAVLLPFWLVELTVRLLLTPGAAVLRAAGALPYRLEVERDGRPVASHTVTGRPQLHRLRADLRARES